ncbi:hypothetical protein V6N12_045066 [Hibiscus sabdariffa]|uniref:Phospholipid-transporting ATPase n=1 Tax=Hibiscus sabdariffa TaxID=183260 RepID=A0ABR2G2I7_9ROSI
MNKSIYPEKSNNGNSCNGLLLGHFYYDINEGLRWIETLEQARRYINYRKIHQLITNKEKKHSVKQTLLIFKSKFGLSTGGIMSPLPTCVSFSPLAPYSAPSIIMPLVVVIGVTMAKEGVEDWRRRLQDIEANNRKVEVYDKSSCSFKQKKWKDLRVGELVKVCKDEYFPADVLLLSSNYEDGVCYVETMNLDGETNLNAKHALEVTSLLHDTERFQDFRAVIKCEDPNEHLYSFVGTLYYDCQQYSLSTQQAMYDEETDRPARARTSNLNEELGQVHTILSDKTGTLTCNSMEFVKCSIAGTAYGRGMTEAEIALARKRGEQLTELTHIDEFESKKSVKGFNFRDERIMYGQWAHEKQKDVIQKFFRVLAACHTVVPEVMDSGEIIYEAESPDEATFVIAAREIGFQFFLRNQTSIQLHELDPESGIIVDRVYNLLHVLEFSSARKRMSVIVRNPENQLLLLAKGADSVIFERLSKQGQVFEEKTKEHIERYSEAGLRTMAVAYRELDDDEYKIWEKEFLKAKTSVTADRDVLVEELADRIERDLILLGATAVEDKLQHGVSNCIDKLARAGIGIWVLTGDKRGTAINIGYACSLLRHGMKQIVITLELPEIEALVKHGDKDAIAEVSLDCVKKQIHDGKSQVGKESSIEFGLIIDGKSLTFAMDKTLVNDFMDLAIRCATVICCRSSPKQKAIITRLVKSVTGRTTLAIGDGANDVGMLQEADIGVGINGVEGMQAVMASDFAIAQFRFLERLLLVHGHWCYRRISMMICYFFYKNITFGFTLFWFEAYTSFSGQPAYNDWYMSSYNVFFTSLPVIALGVFDQDVSARLCLKHPLLYQEGVRNLLFNWVLILGWMFNGLLSSIIIYFLTTNSIVGTFRKDGQVVDYSILGVTMYTCVVWTVNCQMALSINYFTWIQHLFIWGSIALWYIFLVVYGSIPPTLSTTAYKVLVEACAPSIMYWNTTLLVVISALLPLLSYRAFQIRFRPMEHDRIQIQRRRSESLERDVAQSRRSESSETRNSSELPTEVRIRIDSLKASSRRKNS